jgi:hypothetical protein
MVCFCGAMVVILGGSLGDLWLALWSVLSRTVRRVKRSVSYVYKVLYLSDKVKRNESTPALK